MAINYPTTLDTLTNPSGTDVLTSPDHAQQHADANDAIEALQAKVGVDSSAVVTSLDYLVKNSASINPGHLHNALVALDGSPNPAVYVDNDGEVGIGTSTPSGKLHVVTAGSGNVNFDQADSNTSIGFLNGFTLNNTDATTNNYIGILFGDNSASAAGASGGIGMQLTDRTNHYGDFVIVTRGTGGYTEKLRVDSDGLVSFTGAQLKASGAAAPALINTSAQATTPTLVPNQGDGNTGIGQAGADQLSLIAGGVEGIRITEAGSAISAIDMNGPVNLGANNLNLTGSIASTGSRATKLWATDIESTNMPTVGGTAILSSLTAPQFTTIELGHATDTTLSRVSAGVVAIEGVNIVTESATQTLTNKTLGATTLSGTVTGGDQNITGLGRVSFTQELDNGSKTASFSIDFGTDQKQKVTLTANTMTLTLDTTFDSVGNYLLKIVNGGLATITWASESGSILWAGGAEPTLTSSGTDIISFYYDGTNWYGVASLAFA